jgi:hypothetical protein
LKNVSENWCAQAAVLAPYRKSNTVFLEMDFFHFALCGIGVWNSVRKISLCNRRTFRALIDFCLLQVPLSQIARSLARFRAIYLHRGRIGSRSCGQDRQDRHVKHMIVRSRSILEARCADLCAGSRFHFHRRDKFVFNFPVASN